MSPTLSDHEQERIEMYVEVHDIDSAVAIAGRLGLSPEKVPAVEQLLDERDGDSETPTEDASLSNEISAPDGGRTTEQNDTDSVERDFTAEAATVAASEPSDSGTGADLEKAPYESTDVVPDEVVREHYSDALPIYRELGTFGSTDALLVAGENDNGVRPWYKDARRGTPTNADGVARPYIARRDAGEIPSQVTEWDRPTVYSTINYQPVSEDDAEPYSWDSGHEWHHESPLPGYGDIATIALFADVDFETKERPVTDERQARVEDALSMWVNKYADAVGGTEDVYALDSVGGTFVMLAPRVVAPISRLAFELGSDARERLMGALAQRWRAHNEEIQDHVSEAVPKLDGVFGLDGNTNKNRLYKAPLAIHKSLPGVVTPVDPEDISFEYTLLEDVDGELVDECEQWAASFTADGDSASSTMVLVATLWPDYANNADGWRDALTSWLADEREEERREEQRRKAARERHEQRREELASADDVGVTPSISEVEDAIDRLDAESVAEATIVREWNDGTGTGSGKRAFVPTWGGVDCNGTANYINLDKGTWVDTGANDYGTVVEMALIFGENWTRGQIARGSDWLDGVEALRDLGFEIPVWTPDATESENDQMPFWSLRKFALAFGIVDYDDLEVHEGDDGGTYPGFKNTRDYRRAVLWAEEVGLDTGRTGHLD